MDQEQHIAGSPDAGYSDSRDKDRHQPEGGASSSAVCVDDNWIKSTNLLREIVTRGLLRSTPEVKGNLVKAINNLMCSENTRTALVTSNYIPLVFDLVRVNTSEVRCGSSQDMHRNGKIIDPRNV